MGYAVRSRADFVASYILGQEIAAGSDGTIYRVVPKTNVDRKPLALKVGRRVIQPSAVRELSMLEKARGHPHVVQLLGSFLWSDGREAKLFEEADRDLSSFLRMHGAAEVVAMDVAVQLGLGLDHLHMLKIIHRDLKPANVLVYLERTESLVTAQGYQGNSFFKAVFRIYDFSRR
jgi:serine/threonine protein kinase